MATILFFGIIGTIGFLLGLFSAEKLGKGKSDWWISGIYLSISLTVVGFSLMGLYAERQQPVRVHSIEFKVKTEIQVNSINEKEISRDTVYIFTKIK